jgi:hypothetical protein
MLRYLCSPQRVVDEKCKRNRNVLIIYRDEVALNLIVSYAAH